MDTQYNWILNSPQQEIVTLASKWLETATKEAPNDEIQVLPDVDYSQLKNEQQAVFLQVMAYFKKLMANDGSPKPDPICINVDGTAGTGKSFLICAISAALRELFGEELGEKDPVVCLAPTGISAFEIHGWTMNFGLSIPVKEGKDFSELGASALACLQTQWKNVKLLILDEKSMVGRSQLGRGDRRLCQAFPTNSEETLGGLPAIFFGDFAQLPPIGDTPLYSTKEGRGCHAALAAEGHTVFESFTQSVTLSRVFCQVGNDPEQEAFRDALLRLCTYLSTEVDYSLFQTRFWDNLTPEECTEFDDAKHLLPTCAAVHELNL